MAKRGRPMLSRETVQERLKEHGWTIPEGVKYRGAGEIHTVQCLTCGYITEKVLNNIVYRKETCPAVHWDTPQLASQDRDNTDIIETVASAVIYRALKPLTERLDNIDNALEAQHELIINTAINREDLIEKFTTLYSGTVSRKGYLRYNRKMSTVEWYDNSHLIALELISRLSIDGSKELLHNYEYHRAKNSQLKPEKVLLMVMNKRQLFSSLEQLHIIKLLLQ